MRFGFMELIGKTGDKVHRETFDKVDTVSEFSFDGMVLDELQINVTVQDLSDIERLERLLIVTKNCFILKGK
jgi:hypothetical protein